MCAAESRLRELRVLAYTTAPGNVRTKLKADISDLERRIASAKLVVAEAASAEMAALPLPSSTAVGAPATEVVGAPAVVESPPSVCVQYDDDVLRELEVRILAL
jgi:hypothetical protein